MGIVYRHNWSHSRRGMLAAVCQRAVFYDAFSLQEPFEAAAIRLKGLTNLHALSGTVIDGAITAFLKAHRNGEDLSESLVDRGEETFMAAVAASRLVGQQIRDGEPYAAETTTLHHDYYGYGCSDSFIREKAVRVRMCLKAFLNSDVWGRLSRLPAGSFILPGDDQKDLFPHFSYGNVRISVSPDFCVPFKERVLVLDWKSGSPTGESIEAADHQLAVYAMFVVRKKKVPLPEVWVQSVWLADDCSWRPSQVSEESCSAIEKEIVTFRDALGARMRHGYDRHGLAAMVADIGNFPASPEATRCFNCRFREICDDGSRAFLETAEAES
jgi:hypothetical protein